MELAVRHLRAFGLLDVETVAVLAGVLRDQVWQDEITLEHAGPLCYVLTAVNLGQKRTECHLGETTGQLVLRDRRREDADGVEQSAHRTHLDPSFFL